MTWTSGCNRKLVAPRVLLMARMMPFYSDDFPPPSLIHLPARVWKRYVQMEECVSVGIPCPPLSTIVTTYLFPYISIIILFKIHDSAKSA